MSAVLWLLALQGGLGAFETAYYHEFRARLPVGGNRTRLELWLHAARSLIYALLFATLPCFAWQATLALVVTLIVAEIAITLAEFAVQVKAREPEGVLAGERVTHGLMAIIYGAMLAIYGGTSEIIKSIVAPEVLGMPRSRSWRPRPWETAARSARWCGGEA